ncbi:MAG: twin-arginine translocase TatA/TatE family subunit [Nitrosarchaeum sp.]|nr:MAG: twin-arginine translocase TatA/TatE family subunit [Nitrosarchaeum sp.]
MLDYSLNILGSEWIIIIFVALILILGTNQLPSAAKKLGKAVNEFNKAKNEVQNQMKGISNTDLNISGPLETERQKLETIAKSLGVNVAEKSDDELRKIISGKMGQKNTDKSENKV